jgi:hypothetical protein
MGLKQILPPGGTFSNVWDFSGCLNLQGMMLAFYITKEYPQNNYPTPNINSVITKKAWITITETPHIHTSSLKGAFTTKMHDCFALA